MQDIEQFYPQTKQHWRNWLAENHQVKDAVWVIFYNKKSAKPTISWSDAVDEALCFGWIDSVKKTLNEESFIQFFSKRKKKSTWSKINKEKVDILIESGHMTHAGLAIIEIAKQNGSWQVFDEVETLAIPDDLLKALQARQNAETYFNNLSKSSRKAILQWLILAKRQETRQNRITEIADLADKNQKPKQF